MGLRSSPKNKGFSLLEVIIAVAILSTGIVLILQALAYSGRVAAISCDYVRAVFLAEDKMEEIKFKFKNQILKPGASDTGEVDAFKWSYQISKVEDWQELCGLDVGITWERANRAEELTLHTLTAGR